MIPAEKYMMRKDSEDMSFTPFNTDTTNTNLPNPYTFLPNQTNPSMQQMCYMLVPCNFNSSMMNNMNMVNPNMSSPNMSSMNNMSNMNYQLDYPNQTNENILPSYNKNSNFPDNNNSTNNNSRNIMLDALREFDFNEELDIDRDKNNTIDTIYLKIEKDNQGTLALLQSYRIPYPISKLIIKRIIKSTLNYCKKDGE